ncbi:hypothetical protein [Holospora curviuscula]|uniref:Uncharacterized protein n=1 Tax=Holospora curviuscula TaxID=1082868 RepID=A0A2S5R8L4_9PROT|nr:hypothetical protein [Holospora curviuscula]PPE03522.1 hypothetical protein HCUR_01066 [Holospora curviuscula]
MKDFYYVNSTVFENQDDPFLVLDCQELEQIKVPDLFPLRIELKAHLEFEAIALRPVIQMQRDPQEPPLTGAVLYQTETFFKSVSLILHDVGWSEFEQHLEAFEENPYYRLDPASCRFIQEFPFTKKHCVLNSYSFPLPCGIKKCIDPKDCILWYCLPRTAGSCTALDWCSSLEYNSADTVPSLKENIEQGEVFCNLVYQTYYQQYRSQRYHFKNNDLWITFIGIHSSEK